MNIDQEPTHKTPNLWMVSEVVISYRNPNFMLDSPSIKASIDAEKTFRENWSDDIELVEEFVALFLYKSGKVKALFRVSRGGYDATVVDIRILFAAAIKAVAASIIVAHNHPSGNLSPSEADIDLTRKISDSGKILNLPLLDHIILAPYCGFYSFADEGIL